VLNYRFREMIPPHENYLFSSTINILNNIARNICKNQSLNLKKEFRFMLFKIKALPSFFVYRYSELKVIQVLRLSLFKIVLTPIKCINNN